MRAVLTIAHGDRSQLRFEENVPDPVPADDEVLIRIAATALNFHDIFTRRGMPGIRIPLPVIVGSDIAGEIVSLGDAVRGWSTGDRVLVDPVYRGGGRRGMIGETSHGGRAELIAVLAGQLIRIPDAVSFDDAAALPLAYGTAYRMMLTRGGVKQGERVLILGASGGVGAACVQLAKLAGAEVVACASSSEKIERLRQLGADHVIDYSKQAILDGIREI
ncbi:MAG: quinone oxidoreductase family protein, partial [Steroidobacteraceae bacterium]